MVLPSKLLRKTEHDYEILEHWNFNCIKSKSFASKRKSKYQANADYYIDAVSNTQRTGEFNCMPIASHPKQRHLFSFTCQPFMTSIIHNSDFSVVFISRVLTLFLCLYLSFAMFCGRNMRCSFLKRSK